MYPMAKAAEAVRALRADGVPICRIADVAGVNRATVRRYLRSRPDDVTPHAETARALEGLADPQFARRFARPYLIGAQRRLRGLMWMGHSHEKMRAELGFDPMGVTVAGRRMTLSWEEYHKIVDLYDRWSMTFDSRQVQASARGLGYHSPLAWDDDTIDNPRAHPRGVKAGPLPVGRELVSLLNRRSPAQIARIYNVTERTVLRRQQDLAEAS